MPAEPKPKLRATLAALAVLLVVALAASAAHAADSRYEGISAAGDVAFFSTTDKLVPGDTDTRRDVYTRAFDAGVGGYVTRQVSLGPTGGNHAFDVQYLATGEDGARAFFSTDERLTASDKDNATDIYVRDLVANATTLASQGGPSCAGSGCGNANSDAVGVPGGVVADAAEVFFVTEESLSTADGDDSNDVYVRDLDGATTILVSDGDPSCVGPCGEGSQPAFFLGASADGSSVVVTTEEALINGDQDSVDDIYRRDLDSGETRLVSLPGDCPAELTELECAPVYGGTSVDGVHVFFETSEQTAAADEDDSQDVYDWSAGTAALASTVVGGGNGSANALYAGSSPDGESVFFETRESLASADADAAQDIYERSAGETTLVTRRAASCEPVACGDQELDARVVRTDGVPSGVYDDGEKIFFFSKERLVVEDSDEFFDAYVRDLTGGGTTLVSQADSTCITLGCGNGAHNANFSGASADGTHAFFVTPEPLVPPDTDAQTDVYDRSGGATTLVSVGSINGNGAYGAQLQGVSFDGSRAFFVTRERLSEEDDLQGEEDVYQRSTSGTVLVSRGNDAELESLLAPPPPKLEATDPASPAASLEPRILGTEAETAAAIKIYTTPDCSGEPAATGTAEELAGAGIAVSVTAGTTTNFRATAEAEGFASACSAPPLSYTQEAPASPPGGGAGGGGGDGSGGSGGSGSGPGAGGGSVPAPPKTHDGIAYVTPATRITFGPAFKTRVRRPVFRFTDATGQPDSRFVCRVDRRRWKSCDSPTRLKGLDRGGHVFKVKAINAVGVWEATASKRRFKLVVGR